MLLVEQKLDIALPFARRAYVRVKGKVVLGGSSANLRASHRPAQLNLSSA